MRTRIKDADWMRYIDAEVRAVCAERDWGHQVRRKWSVREQPVSESGVDDYEWKLLPNPDGGVREIDAGSFDEGVYFTLSFQTGEERFILQHDTNHCGEWGGHWSRSTYTEIRLLDLSHPDRLKAPLDHVPPTGWLRGHLVELTTQFQPNRFSLT